MWQARLSVRDVRVLLLLVRGPASLKQVSEELDIPSSTAYNILQKLQNLGLVARKNNTYEITDEGHRVIREVRRLIET